jgi:hypothetical protein
VEKAAFKKKNRNLLQIIQEGTAMCYIWSISLYGAES